MRTTRTMWQFYQFSPFVKLESRRRRVLRIHLWMVFLVVAMLVFYCICESGARSWRREEFKSIYCFCLCRYITLVSKNIKKKYLSYKNIKRSFRRKWPSMQGCNARARAGFTTLIWTKKWRKYQRFSDSISVIASYKQEMYFAENT